MTYASSSCDPSLQKDASHLTLDNVTFAREGRDILHPISLDMPITRLGIVGRNGSGKSTLARLIAGLIKPTGGILRLNGVDIAQERRKALKEVGILFQNPEHQIIFPTVLEEVAFGLTQLGQTKRDAEARARMTLAHFGKPHWENAPIHRLSQGQKHLLCLMAVTAMKPRLLVLDEPFAGLDIPTKAQLIRALKFYRGNIIHITHIPDDLKNYPHALWIDKGQLKGNARRSDVIKAYLAQMKTYAQNDDITHLPD